VAEQTPISWNSPRMRGVQKEWQSLHDTYDKPAKFDKTLGRVVGQNGKDKLFELQQTIDRLLRTRLSEGDVRQLAASSGTLPARVEEWGFTRDVLAFLTKSFAESGDRERLVTLLSTRCPSRIDWPVNIEFYLARQESTLKDPIAILGEAYSKSQVPETRHVLAAALRRAFAGLGPRGKDGSEYVENAMRWYESEKHHLAVSSDYTMNESATSFTVENYERFPEFYENPKGLTRYPLFETKK
jgi:hypothetical protein